MNIIGSLILFTSRQHDIFHLYYGSFTLADPDSDPYSDSDSCTIQILRERDLDPDLNQCETF